MKSLLVVLATVVSFAAPASAMTCAQMQEIVDSNGPQGAVVPESGTGKRIFINEPSAMNACVEDHGSWNNCDTTYYYDGSCSLGWIYSENRQLGKR